MTHSPCHFSISFRPGVSVWAALSSPAARARTDIRSMMHLQGKRMKDEGCRMKQIHPFSFFGSIADASSPESTSVWLYRIKRGSRLRGAKKRVRDLLSCPKQRPPTGASLQGELGLEGSFW